MLRWTKDSNMLGLFRSRQFTCILLLNLMTTSIGIAAPTYFRTICQDPKDATKSPPKCTKMKAKCPAGQSVKQIRALCESDRIEVLDWTQIEKVPWNTMFVNKTITQAAWACSLAGIQTLNSGSYDASSYITGSDNEMSFGCMGKHLSRFDPSCQILLEYACEYAQSVRCTWLGPSRNHICGMGGRTVLHGV